MSAVITAAIAFLVIRRWGSLSGAGEELLAIVAAGVAAIIVVPVAELAWNFARSDLRLALNDAHAERAVQAQTVDLLLVQRRRAEEWLREFDRDGPSLALRLKDGLFEAWSRATYDSLSIVSMPDAERVMHPADIRGLRDPWDGRAANDTGELAAVDMYRRLEYAVRGLDEVVERIRR